MKKSSERYVFQFKTEGYQKPQQIVLPIYPTDAVREAIVNAICHRDYSIVGGAISIAVFDDRMEIWSDGALPTGITIKQLKYAHQSNH